MNPIMGGNKDGHKGTKNGVIQHFCMQQDAYKKFQG
jgi:hypothetical protein